MPITKLYIEGNLDSELLAPILAGDPLLQQGGSKNALRPRTLTERKENQTNTGYLRDRDFDYDPPDDLSKPTVDCREESSNRPIGWRWCRHEIENYLIEPHLVHQATALPIRKIEDAIHHAARAIRKYEAARWTIGLVRRELPPHYALQTRPDDLNEIALPKELGYESVSNWALRSIEDHRNRIADATQPSRIQESIRDFDSRFDDRFVSDTNNILLWFSGKDILAGMAEWLHKNGFRNPGAFRASVRDWIIDHPEPALKLLPEWKGLIGVLRE